MIAAAASFDQASQAGIICRSHLDGCSLILARIEIQSCARVKRALTARGNNGSNILILAVLYGKLEVLSSVEKIVNKRLTKDQVRRVCRRWMILFKRFDSRVRLGIDTEAAVYVNA